MRHEIISVDRLARTSLFDECALVWFFVIALLALWWTSDRLGPELIWSLSSGHFEPSRYTGVVYGVGAIVIAIYSGVAHQVDPRMLPLQWVVLVFAAAFWGFVYPSVTQYAPLYGTSAAYLLTISLNFTPLLMAAALLAGRMASITRHLRLSPQEIELVSLSTQGENVATKLEKLLWSFSEPTFAHRTSWRLGLLSFGAMLMLAIGLLAGFLTWTYFRPVVTPAVSQALLSLAVWLRVTHNSSIDILQSDLPTNDVLVLVLIGVISSFLVFGAFGLGPFWVARNVARAMWDRSRRMLSQQLEWRDHPEIRGWRARPSVFLRSFGNDAGTTNSDRVPILLGTFRLTSAQRTIDELLVDCFWRIAPVVAVGRPVDGHPDQANGDANPFALALMKEFAKTSAIPAGRDGAQPYGASRVYYSDDSWQENVLQLLDRSHSIIILADSSEGVRWEMEQLHNNGHHGKTLVLLPADKAVRLQAMAKVASLLPSSFDNQDASDVLGWWQPNENRLVVFRSDEFNAQSYLIALRHFYRTREAGTAY